MGERRLVALVALVAACADSGGGGAVDAPLAVDAATIDAIATAPDARRDAGTGALAAAEPCAATVCGPPTVVTSAAELVALLDGLQPWPEQGRLSNGCVPPTGELEVHGTITLDIAALARPSFCRELCAPRFDVRTTRATCVERADAGAAECRKVRIADAIVRFIPYVHWSAPPLPTPTVAVVDACAATSCGAGERMCAANQTCWMDRAAAQVYEEPTRLHCLYCLGLPWQQCACWDGERPRADGSPCVFWISGDLGASGTCSSGFCVY